MPQLNPALWFSIFILAWLTLIILLTKILNSKPHPSTTLFNKQPNKHHWAWPWS